MSTGPIRMDELVRSARADRLRARLPRYLALGALVILCLAGLRSIVAPAGAETEPAEVLVDVAAEELAMRFARTYLTYDAARPDARERALAAMVPEDLDTGAGSYAERGSQEVEWVEVAQHQEALAGGVIIVVAAQIAGDPAPTYLAVPIERRSSGALQISGYPSLVGPPTLATGSSTGGEEVDDPEISQVVSRVVSNYLAGEESNLKADLTDPATYSLPTEQLTVRGGLLELRWAAGPETPAVLATVEAVDGDGASWTFTYEVGIDQSGDRTYATYIETVPNA
jgi:hypothetical protein